MKLLGFSQEGLIKGFFVHGTYGQHGFFREKTEKVRLIREIRVQKAGISVLEKAMMKLYVWKWFFNGAAGQ